jgi:RHS repeat-associated protein
LTVSQIGGKRFAPLVAIWVAAPLGIVACAPPRAVMNSVATDLLLVGQAPAAGSAVETTAQVATSIQYYDGLGKLRQSIAVSDSPQQRSIVTPVTYDAKGRQARRYLPYAATDSVAGYRPRAFAEQRDFYASPAAPETTPFAFAINVYERSPRDFVVEKGEPGRTWQPLQDGGLGRTEKRGVRANFALEIRRWRWDAATRAPLGADFYEPGTIKVETATTVEGVRSLRFIDRSGRTLLVRQLVRGDAGQERRLDTYYIHDDRGNVRFLLPPMAIERMRATGSWYVSSVRDLWATEYVYDGLDRRVETRIPGAAPLFTVYDRLNRPVLTQDGELRRSNRWIFTKYDVHGRKVLVGVYHDDRHLTREAMQSYADGFPDGTNTFLFERRVPAASPSLAPFSDYFLGYSDQAFPPTPQAVTLEAIYYDDYDFNYNGNANDDYQFIEDPEFPGNRPATRLRNRVTGIVTRTSEETLPAADLRQWIVSAYAYDEYGRVIQQYTRDHVGLTIDFLGYDFAGRLTHEKKVHTSADGFVSRERYVHDHRGRLLRHYHRMNADPEVLMAEYRYDALGELIEENLHSTDDGATFSQSVDYRHNVRGWLTRVNDPDQIVNARVDGPAAGPDLFGLALHYDRPHPVHGGTPRFGGQIAATTWSSASDSTSAFDRKSHTYLYRYDDQNQLREAHYRYTGPFDDPLPGTDGYTEFNSYDANGNILTSRRFGPSSPTEPAPAFDLVDDLIYSYRGNQLLGLDDAVDGDHGGDFDDGGVTHGGTSPELTYDRSGRMVEDRNSGITVRYNFSGLPTRVDLGRGSAIEWAFGGTGEKLRERVVEGSAIRRTIDYSGEVVYVDGAIAYVSNDLGRVRRASGGGYEYDYFIRDQLGSVRTIFTGLPAGETRVLSELHYYPFGREMPRVSREIQPDGLPNRTAYHGKELTRGLRLGWYHYGVRFYDPRIARWHVMDPADELQSPYAYVANDPISLIDRDGSQVQELSEAQEAQAAMVAADMAISAIPVVGGARDFDLANEAMFDALLADDYTGVLIFGGLQLLSAGTMFIDAFSLGTASAATMELRLMAKGAVGIARHQTVATVVRVRDGVRTVVQTRVVNSLDRFQHASKYGIGTYKELDKAAHNTGLEVHHLIEKRFADVLGVDEQYMKSIVLTPAEHRTLTNAWESRIPYRTDSALPYTVTKQEIFDAAREIYRDYPEILDALGLLR